MKQPGDPKEQFLRSVGGLHPHPKRVRDPQFQPPGFFDPRDLAQVRYEMLRRHQIEGQNVAEAARAFGISRQHYYQLALAFEERGFHGLLPRKRGPRGPHKCSEAILDFVRERRLQDPGISWGNLADQVEQRFGLRLHPRTLERRWRAVGKKLRTPRDS